MSNPLDNVRLTIAVRLRKARQNAGLTQDQVSRLLGIHRPSVSEFEAGRRRVGADELKKLADIYHVSVSWITNTSEDDTDVASLKMAARELSALSEDDLDRLMDAIKMIKIRHV